jgi:hypothetical protein
MFRYLFFIVVFVSCHYWAFSQKMETKFFIQPIPVFNLSTSSSQGVGETDLTPWNIGVGLGTEVELKFNKKNSLIPFF